MKILIVSLLRLGDLIMLAPVISGIRARYPRAEIHLLTNDSNRSVVPLMPHIVKTHYFERNSIQQSLGTAEAPLFWGYHKVRELVHGLNQENYSLCINFTHTKLSGYLMGQIHADEKQGVTIDAAGRVSYGSPWFRYLNDISTTYKGPQFHFMDVFMFATDLEKSPRFAELKETHEGRSEADKFLKELNTSGRIIAIQTRTSEEKKNWQADKWVALLKSLTNAYPADNFVLTGAPDEIGHLTAIKDCVGSDRVQISICSMAGAYSILKKANFVLSVDTSIKHLAAATQAKVIELSLGSSDYQQTGISKSNSYIIRSKEKCAPCPHSAPCSREKRFCSVNISADSVFAVMSTLLSGRVSALKTVAADISDEAELLETQVSNFGFWLALPVGDNASSSLDRITELAAWKYMFQKSDDKIAQIGSLGVELSKCVSRLEFIESDFDALDMELSREEQSLKRAQNEIVSALKEWGRSQTREDVVTKKLKALEASLGFGQLLTSKWLERNGQGLGQIRAVQSQFDDIQEINQIQLKILRTIEKPRGQNEQQ